MKDATKQIERELAELEAIHGGLLKPESVVEYAQDENTALHSQFEWDDSKAGHAHRLWQARQIINVRVRIEPRINEPVRVYVSLPSDRKNGGGYRTMAEVMNNDDMMKELHKQALSELVSVRRKYAVVRALAGVFSEIEKAQQRFEFEEEEAAATAAVA